MTSGASLPTNLKLELLRALIGSAGVSLIGAGLSFFVGVQLARTLGPSDYGVYGSLIAATSILSVVAQAGLPKLLTREMSSASLGSEEYAKGAVTRFTTFVAAASIVLLLCGFGFLRHFTVIGSLPVYVAILGILLVPALSLSALFTAGLRGLHRPVDAQFQEVLTRPLLFLLLLFAARLVAPQTLDVQTAIVLQTASAILALLIIVGFFVYRLPVAVRKARARQGSRWAATALPMAGTELVRIVDGQAPILLLSGLVAIDEAGFFRVAVAIVGIVGLPTSLANLVAMPQIARLYSVGDMERLQKLLTVSALAAFGANVLATVLLFLFGRYAIELVFGETFVPAWQPLCLLATANCVNMFFGCAPTVLNMCGKELELALIYFIGTAIGLVLVLGLAPRFGATGAAMSAVVAEFIRACGTWIVARKFIYVDSSILSAFIPAPIWQNSTSQKADVASRVSKGDTA